jgi:hypothetical protein
VIRYLKIVLVVAKRGSFTAVSDNSPVTQYRIAIGINPATMISMFSDLTTFPVIICSTTIHIFAMGMGKKPLKATANKADKEGPKSLKGS